MNKMIKKLLMSGMALAMSLTMMQSGGASFVSVNAQEQNEWITEQTEGQEPETVETVPLSDEELPDLEEIRSLLSPQAIVESAVVAVQTGENRDLLTIVDHDAASVDVRVLDHDVNWSVPGSYKATYRVDVKNTLVSYRTSATIRVMEPETPAEKTVEAAEEESSEEADPAEADADQPAVQSAANPVKIKRKEQYIYSDYGMGPETWWTYQYYINEQKAYCIEANKPGVSNGSGNLIVDTNPRLLKTFYYGFNGPGQAQGIDTFRNWSDGQKFIVTHAAASNAYGSPQDEHLNQTGLEMVQAFEALVQSLEKPTHVISVDQSQYLSGAVDDGRTGILRSQTVHLQVFACNDVQVSLPAGLTLVQENGSRISGQTVTLTGSQSFHLEKVITPDMSRQDQISLKGTIDHEYANHVVETPNYIQNFGYLSAQQVQPGQTSFIVEWDTVQLDVSKVWDDDQDRDGLRPSAITASVIREDTGQVVDTLKAMEETGWKATSRLLPARNSQFVRIPYSVREDSVPEGYNASVSGSQDAGFVITNTHEAEMIPIKGLKIWDESMGASRPESITVHLHANGERIDTKTVTPDENGDWKYSFGDRPVYEKGEKIEYALVEEHVGDYTASYEGMTIRNTYDPGKRTVSVFKVWEDAEDQDGLRPESVEVELLKNGQKTGITAILNEANGWHHQFTDLDEYDLGQNAQKVLNVYTVAEITEVSGYVTSYEGDMDRGIQIVNRHETETVEIQVSKVWEDKNDQDGVRPDSIELILFADGVKIDRATVSGEDWSHIFTDLPRFRDHGQEILYTVVESDVNDYVAGYETEKTESGLQVTITNRHQVELTSLPVLKVWQDGDDQDGLRPGSVQVELLADGEKTGQTAVLSQENGWFFTFEDLDRYAAGKEILYTVEEVTVEGYETDYILEDGVIQVVNTHDPELTEVSGSKTWEDAEDQDGVRPESITIHLVADGEIVETRTISEEDDWSWTFEALPKYDQGCKILYAIMEEGVDGYSAETDGYDLINRWTPDQTSVFVTKSWKDSNDSRKIRPDQVTVELYANGEATGQTLVLSEENHWTAAFQNLALNQDGSPVEYTLVEQEVKGYTSTVKGDAQSGFTVVNTIDPERPATGASSNGTGAETQIELWTVAAFLSLMAASVLRRRRK